MGERALPPYTVRFPAFLRILPPAVVALCVLPLLVSGGPIGVMLVIAAVVLAIDGIVFWRLNRIGITADSGGVEVRNALWTTTLPWSDVAAIEVVKGVPLVGRDRLMVRRTNGRHVRIEAAFRDPMPWGRDAVVDSLDALGRELEARRPG